MRTIQHWIAGSETTGTPTRFGPVYDPARHSAHLHFPTAT